MKTLTDGLRFKIESGVTTLAVCWRIEREDGVVIRGTQHDMDITIEDGEHAGTYVTQAAATASSVRSGSDMSADNLEVDGPVARDLTVQGLRADEIEAGLYDNAEVVLFLHDWQTPANGQIWVRRGNLGVSTRTSEGHYKAELRGLMQRLSQQLLRTYSVTCDAELFDARCGLDPAPYTHAVTVSDVNSRKSFEITVGSPALEDGYLDGGLAVFTSGANDTFSMEIKTFVAGVVILFQAMPHDIEVGDTLTVRAGCDKLKATCKDRFNNLLNFRGHAFHVPGQTEVLKIGGQGR